MRRLLLSILSATFLLFCTTPSFAASPPGLSTQVDIADPLSVLAVDVATAAPSEGELVGAALASVQHAPDIAAPAATVTVSAAVRPAALTADRPAGPAFAVYRIRTGADPPLRC